MQTQDFLVLRPSLHCKNFFLNFFVQKANQADDRPGNFALVVVSAVTKKKFGHQISLLHFDCLDRQFVDNDSDFTYSSLFFLVDIKTFGCPATFCSGR